MELQQANQAAAGEHVRRIVGPTILMGDGLYFDFVAPDAAAMTIEDYAWALASKGRFSGQTRYRCNDLPDGIGPRCVYNVCQHVVLLAERMLAEGHGKEAAYEGLMHESDEVVWPDFPGPGKELMPQEFKELVKRSGDAIDARFGVTGRYHDLVKQYDIRMLATEKRELMPHARKDVWAFTYGYEPFDLKIACWEPDLAVAEFLHLWRFLMALPGADAPAR